MAKHSQKAVQVNPETVIDVPPGTEIKLGDGKFDQSESDLMKQLEAEEAAAAELKKAEKAKNNPPATTTTPGKIIARRFLVEIPLCLVQPAVVSISDSEVGDLTNDQACKDLALKKFMELGGMLGTSQRPAIVEHPAVYEGD